MKIANLELVTSKTILSVPIEALGGPQAFRAQFEDHCSMEKKNDSDVSFCFKTGHLPLNKSCILNGGFPGGTSGKEPTCHCRRLKRRRFDPWIRKIPWRRAWQPTPVFLPGESHGQRGLGGYSPWDCRVGNDNWSNLAYAPTHPHTHTHTHPQGAQPPPISKNVEAVPAPIYWFPGILLGADVVV